MAALPFADSTFDAIVMLDVLEHLADTGALVREMDRVVRKGGVVVIMVPAGPELWSYWDEMHGHQRRYTRAALASVFGEGWRRETVEYSFSWMYPIVWGFRRFMQRRRRPPAHSDFIEIPGALNALLVGLGRIEGRLQKYVSAPFGTTLCGVWFKDGGQ
jgi:SAM-dependent methyltransferase